MYLSLGPPLKTRLVLLLHYLHTRCSCYCCYCYCYYHRHTVLTRDTSPKKSSKQWMSNCWCLRFVFYFFFLVVLFLFLIHCLSSLPSSSLLSSSLLSSSLLSFLITPLHSPPLFFLTLTVIPNSGKFLRAKSLTGLPCVSTTSSRCTTSPNVLLLCTLPHTIIPGRSACHVAQSERACTNVWVRAGSVF